MGARGMRRASAYENKGWSQWKPHMCIPHPVNSLALVGDHAIVSKQLWYSPLCQRKALLKFNTTSVLFSFLVFLAHLTEEEECSGLKMNNLIARPNSESLNWAELPLIWEELLFNWLHNLNHCPMLTSGSLVSLIARYTGKTS